jgi:predicted amidohydrolase
MKKYIACVIQIDTQEDYNENLKTAKELICEAAERGAKVVALPENWAYQGHDYLQYAEDMPGGNIFNEFSKLAVKYGVWIHAGSLSEKNNDDPRPYNTTMLINPNGELVAKYNKIHVFDVDVKNAGSYRESDSKKPGKNIVVVDTEDYGKFGLSICYDMRFPELYRLMALQGAEVFFAPSSFLLATGKDHWETLLRARAIENSCYMLAPGQCGVKYDGPTYGRSMIIDPWGTVIATASDKPCVITAEIDLEFRQKVKKQLLSLENRREDIYKLNII